MGGAGGPPSPPVYTRVCTEGRLTLEFTYDDMMRIRTWHLAVRQHRELVPRSSAAAAVAAVVMMQQGGPGGGSDGGPPGGPPPPNAEIVHQQVAKNITRQGITNSTLNYLRVSIGQLDVNFQYYYFSFTHQLSQWNSDILSSRKYEL